MQTYYIINPRRGAEIPITKKSVGPNTALQNQKSSTILHLMMHLFMAHELTIGDKWVVNI
jgi:hypothetical protein